MQFSRGLWLWLGVAVVAIGILFFRMLLPHRAESPTRPPVSDLSVTSPLNQPGGGVMAPEAYEVYSALYQEQQPEPLAFAEDSLTDIPQVNGNCLKPATPQEHEMAEGFVTANRKSHRWEKRFTIPSDYQLISHGDLTLIQGCIETHTQNTARCAPYRQLRHVRYLGAPGFDSTQQRALVSVVKKCGQYCGGGGIFAVEKSGNTWRRVAPTGFTQECSWMY